ncbi:DUF1294 domain-containing protein [Halalkalibacter krulwichiae]|uniref:DUF1294 domain-containing protein n=1 Tax=Halalkalibacter krulwichiae TaxID=199441 RepID=A0A1X9MDZ9_9BACI|nr:DUF1294 domain-containing protein [Halalkalibacter krulwichiae]ARK31677.1 hypothetical protein BkAM31D_18530 [Halalkalibacter krulwichiae]
MILTVYLFAVNLLAYVIMGMDKARAKKRQRRIREKTLFLLAFFGGSLGIYVGMRAFRHKTKHKSFTIGIPIILFAQIAVLIFILQVVSA